MKSIALQKANLRGCPPAAMKIKPIRAKTVILYLSP
jgi:hypothetical protein